MNSDELLKQASKVDIHQVGFHPIIRAYMQRLGLVELINGMVGGQMETKPGLIVAGMIQDTLSGRSPLYHLEKFFADHDTELLLGEPVEPSAFGDHNVGRVLDRIQQTGPNKIFSEVARRASVVFDLDTRSGHWDSTSVNVWGDYNCPSDGTINITHGYSKDHRPDLKQFMLSMLCVEHNIPIMGETHDGNSSDKTLNNKLLTRINKNLAKHGLAEGAFTYVADSAMVTKDNLACFEPMQGNNPFYFVTRLPFSYSEADRVVTEAIRVNQWQEIGVLATSKPTPKRPSASYRACDTEVDLYGRTFRAIVIHSSAHDKRRQKRIDKELTQARQTLANAISLSLKTAFFCLNDAEAELKRILSLPMPCHNLVTRIEEEIKYGKGRPPTDGQQKIASRRWRIHAEIVDRPEVVDQKRAEAGCFVLLSNRPCQGPDAQTSEELLRTYKAQDGIERNFSFLKDPLIVNDLFLKKPERIEALGMILLLCLLIWNLMQRQMRQHLEKTNSTIEGLDRKKTNRPTSYIMTTKFTNILILKVGQARLMKKPLSPTQQAYVKALGLTDEIFTSRHPPP
ncbi:MAG: IS1634 family transposase [Desulfobacterales bacterium]|nr:IS1634 family transposase [Desulfobacterales bacterium]